MIENILLGILFYQDLTLYEIQKGLARSVEHFYSSSAGSIHPALKRLEAASMVNSKKEERNGRLCKVYSILEAGKDAVLQWIKNKTQPTRYRDEGLIKLYFMNMLPREERIAVLSEYIGDLQEEQLEMNKLNEYWESRRAFVPEPLLEAFAYRMTTLEFGLRFADLEIEWYKEILERIQKGEL